MGFREFQQFDPKYKLWDLFQFILDANQTRVSENYNDLTQSINYGA